MSIRPGSRMASPPRSTISPSGGVPPTETIRSPSTFTMPGADDLARVDVDVPGSLQGQHAQTTGSLIRLI